MPIDRDVPHGTEVDSIMIRLYNSSGSILISKDVFTVTTGDAATNCFGVKGMTVRSVTDGLVHLLKRESMGKGVRVINNGDDTVSIELHIAVDEGVNIPVLCGSIISEVRYKLTSATGVEVKRVDVYVDSIIIG
ncbi:MAG: Asp23/Gls24 family envelope stress response protein [Oscillospiraceae bacterium]|jgi:uncharacterized alkaline shock family protein YloU|nr:Asp23/Gls24 family envelope stress response protein [Oscillospiraceae bacterium]